MITSVQKLCFALILYLAQKSHYLIQLPGPFDSLLKTLLAQRTILVVYVVTCPVEFLPNHLPFSTILVHQS